MVAVGWVLCVAKGFGLWVFLVMVFSGVEWVWWCGLVIVLRVCFFGAGFACMLFIV